MGQSHVACYTVSVVAAIVMVIAGACVHLLGWWQEAVNWDVFDKVEGAVWARYESGPAGVSLYYRRWLFGLWAAMYVGQLAWSVYGLELVCRKARSEYSYHYVPVVPSLAFLLTAGAQAAVLGWLFLWTNASALTARYAPLCLLAAAVAFYVALGLSVGSLSKYLPVLHGMSASRHVWEIRLLVHNGLGLAAAWTTTVLFYCLVVLLAEHGVLAPGDPPVYVFLGLLAAYTLLWFGVDVSVGRRYSPYLLTPYVVFLLAQVQVLLRSELIFGPHFIASAVLMGVTCVLLLVRFSVAVGSSIYK